MLRYTPYRYRYRTPWISRYGRSDHREGFLLLLEEKDGRFGMGEAAPLPELGTETLEQCRSSLESLCQHSANRSPTELLQQLQHQRHTTPALYFGVESAVAALEAGAAGEGVRQWLSPESGDRVRTNQQISAHNGFRFDPEGGTVLKLKIGIDTPERELEQLLRLGSNLPDRFTLRLDANRAWPYRQAEHFLLRLSELPIDSVEEPLRHPTLQRLERLQRMLPFPLAIDESLSQLGIENIPGSAITRVVLKPSLIGGLRQSCRVARQLLASGIEVVVTTLLESNIGALAVAHCAAAIDPDQQQTHGLSTIDCFRDDPVLPPLQQQGIVVL